METKADIILRIRRRLGWPMIKVEVTDGQVSDIIDSARQKFIKWAAGNATQETYFTMMLSAGQKYYDLPIGVVSVVDYDSSGGLMGGGINTLFTVENYMYSNGMLDGLMMTGQSYDLVSFYLAKQFFETLKKFVVDKYTYKYHKFRNVLEISPAPGSLTSTTAEHASFVLIRSFMIEGSTLGDTRWNKQSAYFTTPISASNINNQWDDLYSNDWIFDYSLALTKITLGLIRRKFNGFQSLGNSGIQLDGEALIAEGKEEREKLDERLRLEEPYEGLGIYIG